MNPLMETIGGLGEIFKTISNNKDRIDAQEVLIKAKSQALDILTQNTELQQQIAELRSELRKLKDQAELANRFFYARHAYWSKDEKDGSAYCPTCFDRDKLTVRLTRDGGDGFCTACKMRHKHAYYDNGTRPKEGDPATISIVRGSSTFDRS